MSITFTIGSDPELFLFNKGVFASAFGLFHGTKEAPEPIPNGALQVDGMALEFNTDPAKTSEEFVHNISAVLQTIRKRIAEHDLEIGKESSVHFQEGFLESQPEAATELGCDPDTNAYTGEYNESPEASTPMRTAGGHIHVGWGTGLVMHEPVAYRIIKMMDLLIGIPSVIIDRDVQRRSLYGKAGACRVKDYGVEYRTLSNFWIHSEALVKYVYDQSIQAAKNFSEYDVLLEKAGVTEEDVQEIINTSDVLRAGKIIKDIGIQMPEEV